MMNQIQVENYIYIYQLDKYLILPVYPDNVQDELGSTFNTTNILARTAPIQSYAYSGPRTLAIQLLLHRELVDSSNLNNLQFLNVDEPGDDYIDTLVKYLQAMALPTYGSNNKSSKIINPPEVALRIGNTAFIKGVVSSPVRVNHHGPLSRDKKYQEVDLSFTITEVDPQDATSIAKWGSFRGLESVLTKNLYKTV